jgi:RNA ligase
MNYKFPTIKRIEDVLPAIAGRDEFIVAERDGFRVINYNVGYADTFTIDEDDVMDNYGVMIPKGVMRRECRGLIFYPDGAIMSRPFHKFFNVGERDETQMQCIDMSQPHTLYEKMDGSMIRPMMVNGVFRLGTKMGVTDTSIAAEAIYTGGARSWMDIMMKQHVTPLFEFVSPDNRIVLKYDKPELVLLAIRHNITGEYLDIEGLRGNEFFPVVPSYGALDGNFDEYIARQRGKEGREGDIIRFDDGHMLKIKNDWYVRIHKVKDKIRTDRHVLSLLLANDLDDVYPHLDEIDYNYVKSYEAKFHAAMIDKVAHLNAVISKALADAGGDKKKLAIEILPATDLMKHEYGITFKMADGGHDLGDLVMKHVFASLGNTAKYNDLAAWLGIDADKVEDE